MAIYEHEEKNNTRRGWEQFLSVSVIYDSNSVGVICEGLY